ncbi:hypothetical protein [Duganella callida]|uniref:Transmembrane protein n=1 Tax=Duganella callida TaxID=2561932 RepID=A0A4Y9SJX3_9BURK|nr:hypothetical protein [Duganella callida]TFW26021.1 hypothetical protein E4L98_08710 [Duganella callida]
MRTPHRLSRRLFAPLVYLAALLLLLEDWLWNLGTRLTGWLAQWPPLRRLEAWICRLGPKAALLLFVLPTTLLFPVKLLALWAMAHGYPMSGLAVIVLAKLGGAAAVARLYLLTRPVLLTIAWFAALLAWFLAIKERWIERLRASGVWRRVEALRKALRHWRRHAVPRPGGWVARFRRLLKRFRARWHTR